MAETTITTPRLEVRGLRVSHGNQVVLNGVDLNLKRGETLAILGRSGCGKSTLLRCLSVLQRPDDGSAFLDGQEYLSKGNPLFMPWQIRQEILMVFQNYNLFPNMTCMRNITLALEKTKQIEHKKAENLAGEMAEKLGIRTTLDRYPDSLSGGQAQRLALARAMVLQPKVLLLDEITSGLDPETIVDVVRAISDLRSADATGELAIILVTHLVHFAADFADRVLFFHQGSVHEELPAKELFTNCQKPETKNFVGAFSNSSFEKDLS